MSLELWDGFCEKCEKSCCTIGQPVIYPFERQAIIDAGGEKYLEEYDGYSILRGTPCPFWKDKKCTIQHCKPIDCEAYPILVKPGDNGKPEWMIDPDCPACTHLSSDFIKKSKFLYNKLTPEEIEIDWKILISLGFNPVKLELLLGSSDL
ncbi:YkgJ family cysteine cluster protein [Desulfonema magnum]|uniref:YkgJ family cysteine cluster protein n=1 Tax=Desulfonema magnum TaxID=45655 RepID=A0A975BLT2_9BACT|nr:hypothetical protein [Desulfonema magnum]QTA87833.1 Uncharacterized protein dnm_038700 [Desulfonema magnum]